MQIKIIYYYKWVAVYKDVVLEKSKQRADQKIVVVKPHYGPEENLKDPEENLNLIWERSFAKFTIKK
jgi:hypothetical protein